MYLENKILSLKFFRNKEFNQLYLSIFVMTFGESLINIFVPIYLFNLGMKVYEILFFYFFVSLYFLFFFYLGAKIVSRVGERHAILLSAPFLVLYYLGLEYIETHSVLFYILPLFLALRMILFNYGHHLLFVNHSEKTKRGRELAFFGVLVLVATTLGPYIGGYFADINFTNVFLASSFLIIIGTTPLFFAKEKYEKIIFTPEKIMKKIFHKKNRGNLISFSGYAMESIIERTVWPIFIIIVVGSVYQTGFLISASMFVSLLVYYFIGKITDESDKIRLLEIGNILYCLGWLGRIFANTSFKIFFVNSYKNIAGKILRIPWSAHSYDLAKEEDCFEFIVSREVVFNLVRVLFLPAMILIFWIDFYPFFVSFVVASIFSLGYMFISRGSKGLNVLKG